MEQQSYRLMVSIEVFRARNTTLARHIVWMQRHRAFSFRLAQWFIYPENAKISADVFLGKHQCR